MTTIAIINEKGGAGKTTTAVNLAAAWADMGKSVLLVDFDPQASATHHVGLAPDASELLAALLTGKLATEDTAHGFEIVKGGRQLAKAEATIDSSLAVLRLKRALEGLPHDIILIDCPPTLGFLTESALAATDKVLVPLEPSTSNLVGLAQLMATLSEMRQLNPTLDVDALLVTDFDQRRNHDTSTLADVEAMFPGRVLPTIPTDAKVKESFEYGKPVYLYAPGGRAAAAYKKAATTLLEMF